METSGFHLRGFWSFSQLFSWRYWLRSSMTIFYKWACHTSFSLGYSLYPLVLSTYFFILHFRKCLINFPVSLIYTVALHLTVFVDVEGYIPCSFKIFYILIIDPLHWGITEFTPDTLSRTSQLFLYKYYPSLSYHVAIFCIVII